MGAHVRHIEISNFKSLRHVSLDGCRRINVFIGAPNAGKSAILEAISLLSYIQPDNTRPITDFCRMKFRGELFFEGNTAVPIGISVGDDVHAELSFAGLTSLELSLQFGLKSSNLEEFKPKSISFLDRDTTARMPNDKIPSGLPVIKKYTYSNIESRPSVSELALNFPNGGNLGEIMRYQPKLRGKVARMFEKEGLKLVIDTENGAVKGMRVLNDESYYLIPFYQMADTLQRLVFHKAAMMSNSNSVLLFEEPEVHLFPPYLRIITGDLLNNKELNNQYFISTHSELILDDLIKEGRDDLSIFVVALRDGETFVKRLDDSEMEEVFDYGVDLIFNIERLLA
jgi:predicted ATPase